ncbi:MAG TPA: heavy metal-associated domain-containing protein [Candidatus Paceibacterota bacterium]|nr:heavy metal-associated domain-containing protein [Candidatus Paceibacterota bacterium]
MKTKFILLLALSIGPVILAEVSASTANETNQFKVTGMSCDGCARGIASELKRLPGVVSADVTFSNKLVVVAYDTNRVSADGVRKAIVDAGYDAKLVKLKKTKTH